MIKFNKLTFENEIKRTARSIAGKEIYDCSVQEQFAVIVHVVKNIANPIKIETYKRQKRNNQKKVYYFSMEFLIGRLLENYLLNLGIKGEVEEGLESLGINVKNIYEAEADPGLGNGGLGRLAACFLDSMAALGVAGVGIGLRYRFGLFRQKIENGAQKELPDAWLTNRYPWETALDEDAVEVRFGGYVDRQYYDGEMHYEYKNYQRVKAVPYDVPIVGDGAQDVNVLRLFDARPVNDTVDMAAFNRGDYAAAMRERCEIEAITCILYPDDSNGTGRLLRLRQEYFMVASGIAMIIRNYKKTYGNSAWKEFPDRISIHTNDTHPALCVPELIRVLIDEENLSWDEAWEITQKTISFTNHTIMPEALEKWPVDMMRNLLPRVFMIVEEIDRRFREEIEKREDGAAAKLPSMAVIWNGEAKMANLSIIGSHSVNGVAALHSEILKTSVFPDFYSVYPERFNNKTNGISHRRFMIQSNPGLAALIDEKIGDEWRRDFRQIERLLEFADDPETISALEKVKFENKLRFADYIKKTTGQEINPDSVFDVQVKRIHAYKRQLLNVLKIMDVYNRLKENPNLDIPNYTFVFAGKAAQGYYFAKEVIRLICSVAELVNNDPDVNKKIQVVFVENFCISNAQIIYPASDISEQISTASKEASGTGNMKFIMNGAVTLGTLDGANIEILQEVGKENIEIFGLNSKQVMDYYDKGGYISSQVRDKDKRLDKILTQFIDGTLNDNFWSINDDLLQHNDQFFVLADFDSYVKAWDKLGKIYQDKEKWGKMSLTNIARSSFFSSDRTIREYADEIWNAQRRL